MKIKVIYILTLIILALATNACYTDDTCRKDRGVEMGMNFYLDSINRQNNRLTFVKLTIDSLWIQGIGSDSIIYNNKKLVNSVKLPLNYFEEESQFRMVFNTITDTITIKHRNADHYISLECGYIRTFEIDTVFTTGNFIDSIAIPNPSVNTLYVENIQLYHHK
ncbi:MAG: DUF6452 family protein [Paludibacteraceae bacterium]